MIERCDDQRRSPVHAGMQDIGIRQNTRGTGGRLWPGQRGARRGKQPTAPSSGMPPPPRRRFANTEEHDAEDGKGEDADGDVDGGPGLCVRQIMRA